MSQTSTRRLTPELTLAAAAIVGSVEHREHGKNDDWDWDYDAGTIARVMIPMWNVWYYRIFAIYAMDWINDWIHIDCGYKSMGSLMNTYESFRDMQGMYREVKLELQQFTFTEARGYEALDCL
jgi:hypothetical protein